MSGTLQVCLYNVEPEASQELRDKINSLNYVRVIAEVGTPDDLVDTLQGGGANLIFFHLDPDPAKIVEVIDHVSQRYPEMAMIAASHDARPDAILAPIRAGCDQFVCEPIDDSELAAAVSRVASKRLLGRAQSRCICLAGATGGTGTTSIACNLAMEIAHLTEKTCGLIDLDLQFGDVAVNFDCDPKYTFHDVAMAGPELDQTVLESILLQLPCNVALLARPNQIEQCDPVSSDAVHRAVELATSIHESVVVDLPRRIDPHSFAALTQADLILVICQLLVPSIRNANRYFESLVKLGIPAERIEVLVNRGDSSGGRLTIKDLEDLIKKPVFACVPNDYQFVARSLDFGRPIAGLDHNNPVRREIRTMAAKIVGGAAADAAQKGNRRGLLGRLLASK